MKMQINKHGSFYIRNGWPTKIIDAVNMDQYIFSPNNELLAVDSIGVGRVMIKAMRYWATVLGITCETKDQQGVNHTFTDFGRQILEQDPYCQDKGTLWLLHRNLACNQENATMWYWAYNQFNAKTFTKEELVSAFYLYAQRKGEEYNKRTIEKEFDCFKNTYVSDKAFDIDKVIDEDTIPFFAPLKLIEYSGSGQYKKNQTRASDIPTDILLYCILSDNEQHLSNNHEINIDVLLEGDCQVGKYMNLSYATLLELLQKLENEKRLNLFNNFGNRHIHITALDRQQVLDEYYTESVR